MPLSVSYRIHIVYWETAVGTSVMHPWTLTPLYCCRHHSYTCVTAWGYLNYGVTCLLIQIRVYRMSLRSLFMRVHTLTDITVSNNDEYLLQNGPDVSSSKCSKADWVRHGCWGDASQVIQFQYRLHLPNSAWLEPEPSQVLDSTDIWMHKYVE